MTRLRFLVVTVTKLLTRTREPKVCGWLLALARRPGVRRRAPAKGRRTQPGGMPATLGRKPQTKSEQKGCGPDRSRHDPTPWRTNHHVTPSNAEAIHWFQQQCKKIFHGGKFPGSD
jgi:hypothetical protein